MVKEKKIINILRILQFSFMTKIDILFQIYPIF